jgi:hypothetical protein
MQLPADPMEPPSHAFVRELIRNMSMSVTDDSI